MLQELKDYWNESSKLMKSGTMIYFVVVLFILTLPYIFTRSSFLGINFTETGQIGDTIGGIAGTFIAIIAAFLTYLAFYVQYDFNQKQSTIYDNQRKDQSRERFENVFFELIRLHRENLSQIRITGHNKKVASDREAFEYMFGELKRTYTFTKQYLDYPSDESKIALLDREKLTITAYIIFFIGATIRSQEMTILTGKLTNMWPTLDINDLVQKFANQRDSDEFEEETQSTEKERSKYVMYDHFEGHHHRLSHYFRHLYQTVKYVATTNNTSFTNDEKYKYMKIIRGQLSNYEQLLLYYNSLSPFGEAWLRNRYLVDYKIIKNIPLPLADFGILPSEKFDKEIKEYSAKKDELFEWA